MQRLFKTAACVENQNGDFEIHLDGKPIHTPLKNKIALKNKKVAEVISHEWQAQIGAKINPNKMPVTQITSTVMDKVAPCLDKIIDDYLEFLHTDLLCYLAEEDDLRKIQEQKYQPVLDMFGKYMGVDIKTTTSIRPLCHPEAEIIKVKNKLENLDEWHLTPLLLATQNSGSAILGWAFTSQKIDAKQMFELMFVDETYQEEYWGLDEEEKDRRENIRQQINYLADFIQLL